MPGSGGERRRRMVANYAVARSALARAYTQRAITRFTGHRPGSTLRPRGHRGDPRHVGLVDHAGGRIQGGAVEHPGRRRQRRRRRPRGDRRRRGAGTTGAAGDRRCRYDRRRGHDGRRRHDGRRGRAGGTGTAGTGAAEAAGCSRSHSANAASARPDGTPFPSGRTAWGIITVPAVDARQFLDDTLAKDTRPSSEIPGATSNRAPFSGTGISVPRPARWRSLDRVGRLRLVGRSARQSHHPNPRTGPVDNPEDACLHAGCWHLLFPAYVGFPGGQEGWMRGWSPTVRPGRPATGLLIANRYRSQPNIVAGRPVATTAPAAIPSPRKRFRGAAGDAERAVDRWPASQRFLGRMGQRIDRD
jgi:hypothetical protein